MKNLGNIFDAMNEDRNLVLKDELSVVQFNSRTAGFGQMIKLFALELYKRQLLMLNTNT